MEIILYAFSVMYSPGPVNFMGLHAGLIGRFKQTIFFFIGVGAAIWVLFIIFGLLGSAFISSSILPYISLIGAVYILYLAYKMITLPVHINEDETQQTSKVNLTFFNGFFTQLLNPKGILAVLPITTVMFPAAKITGMNMFIISTAIAIGGIFAPALYALIGEVVGKKITNKKIFQYFNQAMGGMLVIVAAIMVHDFCVGIHIL